MKEFLKKYGIEIFLIFCILCLGVTVVILIVTKKTESLQYQKEILQYKIEEENLLRDKELLNTEIESINKELILLREEKALQMNKFEQINKQEQYEKSIIRDLDAIGIARKLTERAEERRNKQRNRDIDTGRTD